MASSLNLSTSSSFAYLSASFLRISSFTAPSFFRSISSNSRICC